MKPKREVESEEEFDHCDACGELHAVSRLSQQDGLCDSCYEKSGGSFAGLEGEDSPANTAAPANGDGKPGFPGLKRQRAIDANANGKHKPPPPERRSVPVEAILVNDNVRSTFDQASIDSLAESLSREGLLQPLIVRRAGPLTPHAKGTQGKEFVLVAGERRLRAAKKLGWREIDVVVHQLDDPARLRVHLAENLQRENLNPIELATALERATRPVESGGLGLTQAEAGKLLSVPISQTRVSQAIALLSLPPWARGMLIDGRLDAKHGEALRRWCGQAPVERIAKKVLDEHFAELAQFERNLAAGKPFAKESDRPTLSASDIAGWRWEITAELGDLEGSSYDYHTGRSRKYSVDLKALDAKTLAALEIVHLDGTTYAGNKKLAAKLLEAAKKKAESSAAKASDRNEAKSAKQAAELTPAELKAKKARLAKQTAARVELWYHDWLRVLLAWRLDEAVEGSELWPALTAIALYCASARPGFGAEETLAGAAKNLGLPPAKGGWQKDRSAQLIASAHAADKLPALAELYVKRQLMDFGDKDPVDTLDIEFLNVLVGMLALDVRGAWAADRKSPMRERYWALHGKDQLIELGKEVGVHLADTLKKSQMVNVLLAAERSLPVPKELAKLFPPKAKVKK